MNAGFFCAAAARCASARGARLRYAARCTATLKRAAPAHVPSSSMRPAQMCWRCASRTRRAERDARVACVRERGKAEIGWQRAHAACDAAEARSHLWAALRRRAGPVTARGSAHLRQRRRQTSWSGARAWRLRGAACAPAARDGTRRRASPPRVVVSAHCEAQAARRQPRAEWPTGSAARHTSAAQRGCATLRRRSAAQTARRKHRHAAPAASPRKAGRN